MNLPKTSRDVTIHNALTAAYVIKNIYVRFVMANDLDQTISITTSFERPGADTFGFPQYSP